jgi:hypothetical protein
MPTNTPPKAELTGETGDTGSFIPVNNVIEADHAPESPATANAQSQRLRSARVIRAGHAFVQNFRRGHYELGLDIDRRHPLAAIFAELVRASDRGRQRNISPVSAYATVPLRLFREAHLRR